MSKIKQLTTLEQYAESYANMLFPAKEGVNWEAAKSDFIAGAQWQKKRDKELIEGLKSVLNAIALWPGNLSDEHYLTPTGANDAVNRGNMVVAMRAIAREAHENLTLEYIRYLISKI